MKSPTAPKTTPWLGGIFLTMALVLRPNPTLHASFLGAEFYFLPQMNWVFESKAQSALQNSSSGFASDYATFVNNRYLRDEDPNTHFHSVESESPSGNLAFGINTILLWKRLGFGFKTQQGPWASSQNSVQSSAYRDLVEYSYEVRLAALDTSLFLRLFEGLGHSLLAGAGIGWYQIELAYNRTAQGLDEQNEFDAALQESFNPQWQGGLTWLLQLSQHPWGSLVGSIGIHYNRSIRENRFVMFSPHLGAFALQFPIQAWVSFLGIGLRL